MKFLKNRLPSLITIFFMAGWILNFNACTEQSPLQPVNSTITNLKILKLGDSSASLYKVTEVSEWITVKNGGTLRLVHKGDSDLAVAVNLEILPRTISQDAEVKMTLDDEQFIGNLDVVFEPHGITFSKPAILNILAKGLDFTGIDPDSLDIYYYNPDTGNWEKMVRDAIEVHERDGRIWVRNARLPHFSRYAIAAE